MNQIRDTLTKKAYTEAGLPLPTAAAQKSILKQDQPSSSLLAGPSAASSSDVTLNTQETAPAATPGAVVGVVSVGPESMDE